MAKWVAVFDCPNDINPVGVMVYTDSGACVADGKMVPVRPMPERASCPDDCHEPINDAWQGGWNDCLDAIEGRTDDG